MKHVPTITALLLCLAMGLSGCEQAKDLAEQAAEKAKQDVISEVSKAVNGGEQDKKEDADESHGLPEQSSYRRSPVFSLRHCPLRGLKPYKYFPCNWFHFCETRR